MPNYTAEQVATMLRKADGTSIKPSRVRQLAIASQGTIGTKFAGVWMFTNADVDSLKQRHAVPGPVEGTKRKPAEEK